MEMARFQTEVLKYYNYSQLLLTKNNLIKAKKLNQEGKEFARNNGDLLLSVEFEKNLIIINENLNNVDVVMMIKEAECFDLTGDYDFMGLN